MYDLGRMAGSRKGAYHVIDAQGKCICRRAKNKCMVPLGEGRSTCISCLNLIKQAREDILSGKEPKIKLRVKYPL